MDMDAEEFYALQRALRRNDRKHRGFRGRWSSRDEPSQQETQDVESTDTYHGQPAPDEAITNDAKESSRDEPSQQETRDVESTDTYHGQPTTDEAITNDEKESVGPFHNSTEQDNDNTVPGQIAPSAQDDPDPDCVSDPDSGADINDISGPNIPLPLGSFEPLPSDTSATINNTYCYSLVQNITCNYNDTNTTNNNNDSHAPKPFYILSIRWIGWVFEYGWHLLSAVGLFLAIIIFAQSTLRHTIPSAVVPVLVHEPDAVIQGCRSFHRIVGEMVEEMPTVNDQVTQIQNAAAQGEIFICEYFKRVDRCQKGVAQILEAIHAESWKLEQTVLADPDTNTPLSLFKRLPVLLGIDPSPQSILRKRWISYHILLRQTLTGLESLESNCSEENMKPIREQLERSIQIAQNKSLLLKKANTMPNEDQFYAKRNLVFTSYKNANKSLHSLDSKLLPDYKEFLMKAIREACLVFKEMDENWVKKKEELSEALKKERETRDTLFRELCY